MCSTCHGSMASHVRRSYIASAHPVVRSILLWGTHRAMSVTHFGFPPRPITACEGDNKAAVTLWLNELFSSVETLVTNLLSWLVLVSIYETRSTLHHPMMHVHTWMNIHKKRIGYCSMSTAHLLSYKWPWLHHQSWWFYRWSRCEDCCWLPQLGCETPPAQYIHNI